MPTDGLSCGGTESPDVKVFVLDEPPGEEKDQVVIVILVHPESEIHQV